MRLKTNDDSARGIVWLRSQISDVEWSHTVPHAEGGTEATMERKSIIHLNLTMEEQLLILKRRSAA